MKEGDIVRKIVDSTRYVWALSELDGLLVLVTIH